MIELKQDEILVLRTCGPNGESYGGFRWPLEIGAAVEAPDWEPTYECGHGLHGLPWGAGGASFLSTDDNSCWLLVAVPVAPDNYRAGLSGLGDKCKFRQGRIVFVGNRDEAVALLAEHAPPNTPINFARQKGGDKSMQTAGHRSVQKAGNFSTQTAGYFSTQTAGYFSTQTAGHRSTQTAGNFSTQTAGDKSMQKAGSGTVQIARWYYGFELKTAARIITAVEVDRWWFVKSGIWRLCTEEECARAGARIAQGEGTI